MTAAIDRLPDPQPHISGLFDIPSMPERLARSLRAEGAEAYWCDRYAEALHHALMESGGRGPVGNYEGHTPKRIALAQRLARKGYPASAEIVWREDETIEELEREWTLIVCREYAAMLGLKPRKQGA